MGHTIAPMRYRVYTKIDQLKKMVRAMREPERSIAESLLIHVHQHISSITYTNPLPNEIENNMIFAMLVEEKKKHNLKIEDLTLLIFSLLVNYKSKYPNESDPHRLLLAKRQDSTLD